MDHPSVRLRRPLGAGPQTVPTAPLSPPAARASHIRPTESDRELTALRALSERAEALAARWCTDPATAAFGDALWGALNNESPDLDAAG